MVTRLGPDLGCAARHSTFVSTTKPRPSRSAWPRPARSRSRSRPCSKCGASSRAGCCSLRRPADRRQSGHALPRRPRHGADRLSYTIAQRTRELGLRLALGARPAALRAMVLRQVAAMAAVGCAAGVGAALLLGHTMRALLFNVGPIDPGALAAAAIVLILVVLTAGYLPARRASRINPTVALRCE